MFDSEKVENLSTGLNGDRSEDFSGSVGAEESDMAGDEIENDQAASEFLLLAREAVATMDPPPSEVTELAKIAFQFRDHETVDFQPVDELAHVRSSDTALTMQVTHGTATVIWTIDTEQLAGVLVGAPGAELRLQTQDQNVTVDIDDVDGSFEVAAPVGPYRLIIHTEAAQWATPWTTM